MGYSWRVTNGARNLASQESNMVSGAAFLLIELVGPVAGCLLSPLPKGIHLLLGVPLIFLNCVFVHPGDRIAGLMAGVVRR